MPAESYGAAVGLQVGDIVKEVGGLSVSSYGSVEKCMLALEGQSAAGEWFCVGPRQGGFRCNIKNRATATVCQLCGYPRRAATRISDEAPVNQSSTHDPWQCIHSDDLFIGIYIRGDRSIGLRENRVRSYLNTYKVESFQKALGSTFHRTSRRPLEEVGVGG